VTLRALLRADPTPVTVGPHYVTVPSMMADGWLLLLGNGSLDDVIPGALTAPHASLVADALISGDAGPADLVQASMDAVASVSGRLWYEGVRVAVLCGNDGGAILAGVMLQGIDPTRVTYAAWCAAVLAWINGRLSEEDRTKFLFDFRRPPDGDFSQVEGFDAVQFR